jgi:hypothetical protein
MKICHSLLAAVLLVALVASGQDWQDCKTDTSYSFKEVKGSVHRVTTSRMYTGGDEKTLIRSGDLVSVAILQTFSTLVGAQAPTATSTVPTLINFTGTLADAAPHGQY